MAWGMTKKEVRITENLSPLIKVNIPFTVGGIFFDYACTLEMAIDGAIARLSLLFKTFEKPLLFWYSQEREKVFLYYYYDYDVLLFTIQHDVDRNARSDEVSSEVLQSIVENLERRMTILSPKERQYLYKKREEARQRRRFERVVKDFDDTLLVRFMTVSEMKMFLFAIEGLSEEEYRKLSIPLFDIGVYKNYFSQQRMMNSVQGEIRRKEGSDK